MEDYRIKVGFLDHWKIQELQEQLGAEAVLCLMRLYEFCTITASRHDGRLSGMSTKAIERTARWTGKSDELYYALRNCRLIDLGGDDTFLHDFDQHNPWVTGGDDRKEKAKKAASARWEKKKAKENKGVCSNDKAAYAKSESSICPVSLPPPSPYLPLPSPDPLPPPKSKPICRDENEKDSNIVPDALQPEPVAKKPRVDDSKEIRQVIDHYRTHHPRAHRNLGSEAKEWTLIKARIKEGSTVDDLCKAIDGCHVTPHNIGQNDRGQKYLGLGLIMRDGSQVTRFIESKEQHVSGVPQYDAKTQRSLSAVERWLAKDE